LSQAAIDELERFAPVAVHAEDDADEEAVLRSLTVQA
jgi:hypothetical protein